MPPARGQKSQRLPRCTYSENRRQCTFSGTGDPALCRAHRLILQERAAPPGPPHPGRRPGDAVNVLINNLFSGQRITIDEVKRTVEAEAWAIGGHIAQGYYPHVDDPTREQDPTDWDPNDEPQGARPSGSPPWQSRWSRSPPPPPMDEDLAKQIQARQLLGFAPREPLTKEQIRDKVRSLAKKYHPDRAANDPKKQRELTQRMQAITEAANLLMEATPG